jgi:hypothetical protein
MSYGADGAPGGKLFNADLSNLTLSQPIPESPYEVGRHLIDIAIWIAALFVFVHQSMPSPGFLSFVEARERTAANRAGELVVDRFAIRKLIDKYV